MHARILITFLLSTISFLGISQEFFQRLYFTSMENDTVFYHMSSTTINGEVTALGTTRINDENLNLVITNHDGKGNINWSQEIDLGRDTVTILGNGMIDFNEATDSLLFTIEAEINGEPKQLYGKMTADGATPTIKIVGGNEFATLGKLPKITRFFGNTHLLVTPGTRPTISRIGVGDDLLWSRTYEYKDSDDNNVENNITDLKMTPDSTIAVLQTNSDNQSFSVSELDSNGVQIWAESYVISDLPDGFVITQNITPTELYPLENGNFAIVGEFQVDFSEPTFGFVMVVDTAGVTQFAKAVTVNSVSIGTRASIRNVVQAEDGSIWVSGLYDSSPDTINYFTSNLDMQGNQNWTTHYGDQAGDDDLFTTDLFNVEETGGALLVCHGVLDDNKVLFAIKHNAEGSAMCSDTMSIDYFDITATEDTLTTEVVNGGLFFSEFESVFKTFDGFAPPVLNIVDPYTFCPNEAVDTFLIARVSGGITDITYQWGDESGVIPGAIDDTLFINIPPMEKPQYSVTVTIGEEVCFTMCDTIGISRFTPPMAGIAPLDRSTCVDGAIILNYDLTATVAQGAPPFEFIWNTGSTEKTITIDTEGSYSVTVTDMCGESSSFSRNIDTPVIEPLIVSFGANVNEFCETGNVMVTAGSTGGFENITYSWTNGTDTYSGKVIEISQSDPTVFTEEFTVTAMDECDNVAMFTDIINFPVIATEAMINVEINCNEENPEQSSVTFSANGTEGAEIILEVYQEDQNGNFSIVNTMKPNPITIVPLSTFRVIALNCSNEILDSLTTSLEGSCGGLIQFPKVFFPGGMDDNERTFGPIPNDTMNVQARISDIEFKVFNRWGEQVYEASSSGHEALLQPWDGTHKGDNAPSEVYIWYFIYSIDGVRVEKVEKGDITLVR